MSVASLLFQAPLTSASTDFTIAGQIFTGDPRGQIMLNFLTVGVHSTASAGSTYRLYLARDGAAPALSNLIRVGILGHCSLSCNQGYATGPKFTEEPVNSRRSHLFDETGTGTPDVDEPNQGYVHRGFCPAPFSQEYLGGGQGPQWHTLTNMRGSIAIQGSNPNSAFAMSTPGVDFDKWLGLWMQYQYEDYLPPFEVGGPFPGVRIQDPDDMNAHQLEAAFNAGSVELECWTDGGGASRYKFRAWFGCIDRYSKLAQYPPNPFGQNVIRNGCRENLSYGYTTNPCNFMDCGPVELVDVCPCGKGLNGQLYVEDCLTSSDGLCNSAFCRCKKEQSSTNCNTNGNVNIYEGCTLSQCGHQCFGQCYQMTVGRCNCPPYAPDTVWSHELLHDPDARPYSPPVHKCSNNCDDGTGPGGLNDLCFYMGCCVPQANFGSLVRHVAHPKLLAFEWPYEDGIWMDNADPVAYFENLTDEQNVGKAIGWNIQLDPTTDIGTDRINRRLSLESF
jgi:hypothetical protein